MKTEVDVGLLVREYLDSVSCVSRRSFGKTQYLPESVAYRDYIVRLRLELLDQLLVCHDDPNIFGSVSMSSQRYGKLADILSAPAI